MNFIILWVLLILQPLSGELYIVPDQAGYVGHFAEVDQYGVEAALAHDYLSGALFYQAQGGDLVIFDGYYYQVTEIKTLPAGFDPDYGFDLIYPVASGRLILQTCYRGGYYFVIAEPIDRYEPSFAGILALARVQYSNYLPMVQR